MTSLHTSSTPAPGTGTTASSPTPARPTGSTGPTASSAAAAGRRRAGRPSVLDHPHLVAAAAHGARDLADCRTRLGLASSGATNARLRQALSDLGITLPEAGRARRADTRQAPVPQPPSPRRYGPRPAGEASPGQHGQPWTEAELDQLAALDGQPAAAVAAALGRTAGAVTTRRALAGLTGRERACVACGVVLAPSSGPGRPAKYCGPVCKQAHRTRR